MPAPIKEVQASQDSTMLLDTGMISIKSLNKPGESQHNISPAPETKLDNSSNMKVQVSSRGQQRLSKSRPSYQPIQQPQVAKQSKLKQLRALSPESQGAQYEGAASSPHIKQEYLNARLKSPSNMMRAKSIQANQVSKIPMIFGQAIAQAKYVAKPQTNHESKRKGSNRHQINALANYIAAAAGSKVGHPNQESFQDIMSGISIANRTASHPSKQSSRERQIGQDETSRSNEADPDQSERNRRPRPVHIDVNLVNQKRLLAQHQDENSVAITVYGESPKRPQISGLVGQAIPTAGLQDISETRQRKTNNTMQIQKPVQKKGSHVQLTDYLAQTRQKGEHTMVTTGQQTTPGIKKPSSSHKKDQEQSAQYFSQQSFEAQKQQQQNSPRLGPKVGSEEIINIAQAANKSQDSLQSSGPLQLGSGVDSRQGNTNYMEQETQQLDTQEFGDIPSPTGDTNFQFKNSPKAAIKNLGHVGHLVSKADTLPLNEISPRRRDSEFKKVLKEAQGNILAQYGQEQQSPHLRTKSVLLGHSNAQGSASKYAIVGGVPTIHDDSNKFQLKATQKEVVVNQKAIHAHWQRKRNAMSKNEIKRQSTLLQNLPMMLAQQQNPVPIASQDSSDYCTPRNPEHTQTDYNTPGDFAEPIIQPNVTAASIIHHSTIQQQHSPIGTSERSQMNFKYDYSGQIEMQTTSFNQQQQAPVTISDATTTPQDIFDQRLQASVSRPVETQFGVTSQGTVSTEQNHIHHQNQFNSQIIRHHAGAYNTQYVQVNSYGFDRQQRTNTSHGAKRGPGIMIKSHLRPLQGNNHQEFQLSLNTTNMMMQEQQDLNMSQATFDQSKYVTSEQQYGGGVTFVGSQGISENYRSYLQSWGQGKPTATSSIMHKQTTATKLAQYFEKRNASKSVTDRGNRFTGNLSNRRHKSQQRQIKGLNNLQDFRSKQVDGIKISRLNDLAQREDGNPLLKYQATKDRRTTLQPSGGVQTQILAQFNAEAKFQVEAIQDFSCKGSLYNHTQYKALQSDRVSRLPLKKLVGHQTILLPDKLQARGDYEGVTRPSQVQLSRNQMHQESATNESTDKASLAKMSKLLKEARHSRSPFSVYVKAQDMKNPSQAQTARERSQEQKIQDTSCNDDSDIEQGRASYMKNADLSPSINKVKLHQKNTSSQQKTIQEISLRSRARNQGVQAQQTLNQSNEDLRKEASIQHNKDMKDLLTDRKQSKESRRGTIELTEEYGGGQIINDESHSRAQHKLNETPQKFSSRSPDRLKKISQISGLMDSDDAQSNSALYPVGILDNHLTPTEDDERISVVQEVRRGEDDDYGTAMIGGLSGGDKTPSKKHQVYSHLDDAPSVQQTTEHTPNSVTAETRGASQLKNAMTNPPSDETGQVPMMGVMSIKIQKTKSSMHREFDYKGGRARATQPQAGQGDVKNLSKGANSPILHLDSQQTVVRKSLKDSGERELMAEDSIDKQDNSVIKDSPANQNNRSYQEILNQSIEVDQNGNQNQNAANFKIGTPNTKHMKNEQRNLVMGPHDEYNDQKIKHSHQRGASHAVETSILNLISKKTTEQSNQQASKSGPRSRSNDKSLQNTATHHTDLLDQINQMNTQILAPSQNHSGYHQLEPKLFPANTRAIEKARQLKSPIPPSVESSIDQRPFSKQSAAQRSRTVNPVKKIVLGGGKNNTGRELSNQSTYSVRDSANRGIEYAEEEMVYVRHKAMENSLRGHRLSVQLAEQYKRQKAGRKHKNNNNKSVENNLRSTHQKQYSNDANSPRRPPTQNRNKSTDYSSVIHSRMAAMASIASNDGVDAAAHSSAGAVSDEEMFSNLDLSGVRKIHAVEKVFSKCMNIENLLGQPIKKLYQSLETFIGGQGEIPDDQSPISTPQLSKHVRKGLRRMSSAEISKMYRDHFKYTFGERELYKLLGEATIPAAQQALNSQRRYYLKLTSMQIVNIDCQSGLITDTQPISIPLSKMINLFFLSKDQLQQVLGQSLSLRKENNQIKLRFDQTQLRKNTYTILPRVIREDFFKAPLKVNIIKHFEDQIMMLDSFNVEIHMPRFEIITTADELNKENSSQELLKSTTTHYITGRQMFELIKSYQLLDWVEYAKQLIRNRTFGVDQVQIECSDQSLNKFQRFDHKNDFILYKDPDLVAQDNIIANNLQLSLNHEQNLILQLEYLKPLSLKLNVITREKYQKSQLGHYDEEPDDFLPGYIPDDELKFKQQTVASVDIPFSRLDLIKETFGDKIESGDGCFLECIHPIIQVHVDKSKNMCRLAITSWRKLEELNVRQISQQYFKEQQKANQVQQENLKYLQKTAVGQVKQKLLYGVERGMTAAAQSFNPTDHQIDIFKQRGYHLANKSQVVRAPPVKGAKILSPIKSEDEQPMSSTEDPAVMSKSLLLLNRVLLCDLRIGSIKKVAINIAFTRNEQDQNQYQHNSTSNTENKTVKRLSIDEYYEQQISN